MSIPKTGYKKQLKNNNITDIEDKIKNPQPFQHTTKESQIKLDKFSKSILLKLYSNPL